MRASTPRCSSFDVVREGTVITCKPASGPWTSARAAVVSLDTRSTFHAAAERQTEGDMVFNLVKAWMTTTISDTTVINTNNEMCSDIGAFSATGRDSVNLRNSEEWSSCAEFRASTGVRGGRMATNRKEERSS